MENRRAQRRDSCPLFADSLQECARTSRGACCLRERDLERGVVRSIPASEIFVVVALRPEQLPFDIEGFFTYFEADSKISVNRVELPEKVSQSRVKQ